MGGGTAVDDGVRSQVGELGQGCNQRRGVWGKERQNANATAVERSLDWTLWWAARVFCPKAQQAPGPPVYACDEAGSEGPRSSSWTAATAE